ncbi:MAG: hypothetical protein K9N00_03095 [Candidatus Marinimicrobia bacterium]|nr:hypothetical protein [Candidatus Neomarinimicrobiota bacterium]
MKKQAPSSQKLLQNRLIRNLVYYYGFLQVLHLVALIIASIQYVKSGSIALLAPPPSQDWTQQSLYFFLTMGTVDAANVILSYVFVRKFIKGQSSAFELGFIALTVSMYSAVIYLFPVLMSGAFLENIFTYSLIGILFLPIIVLYFLIIKKILTD